MGRHSASVMTSSATPPMLRSRSSIGPSSMSGSPAGWNAGSVIGEAMQGQFPVARQLIGRGRAIAEEFRLTYPLPWLAWRSGKIEMLAGDLVAAERELRLSYAMYQHMSEKDNLSTVAADLAGVLPWKGHTSESLRLTEESRVLAAREDVWSHTCGEACRQRY